jgi:hypothetical protein
MVNSPTLIGPGAAGLAAVAAFCDVRDARASAGHAEAYASQLTDQLAATQAQLQRAQASAEAGKALANAIMAELAEGKVRRLSNPANRLARVELYESVEDATLRRLSAGRLWVTRTTGKKA